MRVYSLRYSPFALYLRTWKALCVGRVLMVVVSLLMSFLLRLVEPQSLGLSRTGQPGGNARHKLLGGTGAQRWGSQEAPLTPAEPSGLGTAQKAPPGWD